MVQILRRAGNDVRCVNLIIDPEEKLDSNLSALIDVSKGSDLVGLSLFSCYHAHAVTLTQAIKRELGTIPVIWGGVHPTFLPELSLKSADYICIGEGEEAFLEFVEFLAKGSNEPVDNIWSMKGNEIAKTPIRMPNNNLDDYPVFDYDHNGFYHIRSGKLQHLGEDPSSLKEYYGKVFFMITSRGCIFQCSYCSNDSKNKLYGYNYRKVRRFSNERVLNELEAAKGHLPFIESVNFIDDDFISRKTEELAEFCREYKKRIGLPFFAFGNPININQKNVDMLVDAGMNSMQIGVQTGSLRMQKIYCRPISNDKVIAVSRIMEKHKGRMVPKYDFILDNPWENDKDRQDSLELLMQLKEPKEFNFFSLSFFPGTSLQQRALAEGIITTEQMFSSHASIIKNCFYNSLMLLAGHYKMPDRAVEGLKRWKNNPVGYWLLSHSTQFLLSFFLFREALKDKRRIPEIFRYAKVCIRNLARSIFKKKDE